jgi:hypothetical protein
MRRFIPFLVVLLLLGGGRALAAQAARADTAAVLAPVQALLNTLATRDTAAARALLAPGFHLVAMGTETGSAPRSMDDAGFLRTLTRGTERLLERIWQPVVHIQGPIAIVWTPYDFHIDGRFSHCGIDTFTLLRTGTEWRIASLVYTVQPTGCAPSPLGPPR